MTSCALEPAASKAWRDIFAPASCTTRTYSVLMLSSVRPLWRAPALDASETARHLSVQDGCLALPIKRAHKIGQNQFFSHTPWPLLSFYFPLALLSAALMRSCRPGSSC